MRAIAIYISGILSGVVIAACVPALADKPGTSPLPLADIQTVVEIWNRIKADYVDPLEDKTIMAGCISGMAARDAYSTYLAEDEFRALSAPPRDTASVGVTLAFRAGQFVVVAPIDGGPAAAAGVLPGDALITIDEQPVLGLTLAKAVDRLRGSADTEVALTFARRNQAQTVSVRLKRQVLNAESAYATKLSGGIVYLRLNAFTAGSAKSAERAIESASAEAPLKGIIVDLRNNSGGLVNGVVNVASLFIRSGAVVTIEGRDPSKSKTLMAAGQGPYVGIPIAVVVNEGTAAGSEILAESLRINEHAKIIGAKTFGQGSVQTIMPLVDNTALKITTGRWRTASGEVLDGNGLLPDIVLPVEAGESVFEPASDPWVARAERELMKWISAAGPSTTL